MPRRALHTADIKIEQPPVIAAENLEDRSGDVVVAEQLPEKKYMDELAFNEEPVTIRLEPSTEKNAPTMYPVWVNGKGGEVLKGRQWIEVKYFPVGIEITTKRKYVAVLASAKYDSLTTDYDEPGQAHSETLRNDVRRSTSAVVSFQVIEDKNPRGAAWLTEIRRRNFG